MSSEFSGTMPMAPQHRLDEARLAEWMGRHVEGVRGPVTVEQFRGGQSNPTYLAATCAGRFVVRTKPAPAARLLPSAHAIEREYRVMKALGAAGIPVPRMVALCEDEAVLGRAFFVMEFVAGRVLWDQSLPAIDRAGRQAIYAEMNRVISALHSVDPAVAGLADFGRAGNYLERQVSRWTRQYQASRTGPMEAMDRLMAWLPAHIPAEDATAVVHGDFRMDNLVFHPEEPRILAILDWELSTLGNPLADFAYHCLAWHIPPGQFRGIAGLDLAALGIPTEEEYVAMYCRRTGRDRIPHWDFYLAYNLFRLAAILQGIMKRHVEGVASSLKAEDAGRRAGGLAELGWKIASGIG